MSRDLLSIVAPRDLRTVLQHSATLIGSRLRASRCLIAIYDHGEQLLRPPVEWTSLPIGEGHDRAILLCSAFLAKITLPFTEPLVAENSEDDERLDPIAAGLTTLNVRGLLSFSVAVNETVVISCFVSCEGSRPWQTTELQQFKELLQFSSIGVRNALLSESVSLKPDTVTVGQPAASNASSLVVKGLIAGENEFETQGRYRRLVEHSDAIVFNADNEHRILFVSRRALDFFGVSPEDFVSSEKYHWFDFIHPEDRERVQQQIQLNDLLERGLDEEFRVVNRITGRVRWVLIRLVPTLDRNGEFLCFDGFGIDVTARREAQEALERQTRKVRALYTVSSAIRGYLDPATISLRGLAALCEATDADSGVCYLYSGMNGEQLKLVAHHGMTESFPQRSTTAITLSSLAAFVAKNGQSLLITDVENDSRVDAGGLSDEEIFSLLVVPIGTEDETLGAIVLCSRVAGLFDAGSVMLVSAAANQVGLATRQANLLSLYRRQTKTLSALYRLSHELSRNLSLDEVFHQAFSIIRDELGLKRLWLGLLNDIGTRIVGQAAYGPGWKRRLVEMNVEISGRDHPVARVVNTKKPIVIDNPEEILQEFGLRRIFSRLAIHSVVFVPLVAGGQVLGVLAAQPGADDPALHEDEVSLLTSLANEMAVALLTKRLEDRIGEAEKMRTAGLLAAGIAHNFNNVLQAIMGQASLLEMQQGSSPRIVKSSKVITEAANRGASLVKQLLSFAHLEDPRKELCEINEVIERSRESFDRLLTPKHQIKYYLQPNLARASVDAGQLVRILSTILSNAVEAMSEGGEIDIFTDSFIVDDSNPHYDVPYGSYIRIGVRDSGRGMDEETRRRCFEPFFTTKNVDRGSGLSLSGAGLGLAAAYALARRNGGRIAVESQAGHGAVFTVYVPVAQQSEYREVTELGRKNKSEREIPAPLQVELVKPGSAQPINGKVREIWSDPISQEEEGKSSK